MSNNIMDNQKYRYIKFIKEIYINIIIQQIKENPVIKDYYTYSKLCKNTKCGYCNGASFELYKKIVKCEELKKHIREIFIVQASSHTFICCKLNTYSDIFIYIDPTIDQPLHKSSTEVFVGTFRQLLQYYGIDETYNIQGTNQSNYLSKNHKIFFDRYISFREIMRTNEFRNKLIQKNKNNHLLTNKNYNNMIAMQQDLYNKYPFK